MPSNKMVSNNFEYKEFYKQKYHERSVIYKLPGFLGEEDPLVLNKLT